jgi:UDP:flavonoid glycosyltransferase YjiC (YdhE family)
MKIALATLGSRGDVQPFIALGHALVRAGHEVVLCAADDFASFAAEHGLPFRSIGHDFDQVLLPRLRAMVHHGGAGTTHAAARAGIPQVIIPHVLDQFYWAHRTHALGVAPRLLPRKHLSAASLAEALRWCLRPEPRQRARELAAQLRTDGAERAVEVLTSHA